MQFTVLALTAAPDTQGGRLLHGLTDLDDVAVGKILFHKRKQQAGLAAQLALSQQRIATLSLVCYDGGHAEVRESLMDVSTFSSRPNRSRSSSEAAVAKRALGGLGGFDTADIKGAKTLLPALYSSVRHRLVLGGSEQGGEHDGHDDTGRWPGGARPSRWWRRASA